MGDAAPIMLSAAVDPLSGCSGGATTTLYCTRSGENGHLHGIAPARADSKHERASTNSTWFEGGYMEDKHDKAAAGEGDRQSWSCTQGQISDMVCSSKPISY